MNNLEQFDKELQNNIGNYLYIKVTITSILIYKILNYNQFELVFRVSDNFNSFKNEKMIIDSTTGKNRIRDIDYIRRMIEIELQDDLPTFFKFITDEEMFNTILPYIF